MKDLIGKLSSYNLLNLLLPGGVFVVLASKLTKYSLIQSDILTGLFFYYFIGLVVSRFGSLIIEPLLKRIEFLKFAAYENFLAASKNDEKLEVLSETNNTYRTLCSLFILLFVLKIYEVIECKFNFLEEYGAIIIVILLLALFLASYRKQTAYITKRIKFHGPKQ